MIAKVKGSGERDMHTFLIVEVEGHEYEVPCDYFDMRMNSGEATITVEPIWSSE